MGDRDRGLGRPFLLIYILAFAMLLFTAVAALSDKADPKALGLRYLEGLGQPGALPERIAYVPPSEIDPSYSHVIYVNAALKGAGAQKMWVLERTARGGWQTALWDDSYWSERIGANQRPPYSWPVSTGRKYPGDKRSGPTPLGIFNMDDRNSRHRPGWGSPGMWNSIFIDLHYSSGRASGVAMHGTTKSLYRNLGRADSHGCIRMRQPNADQVWDLIHPDGVKGPASPLWGNVPRYFTSQPKTNMSARRGYVRDGSFHYVSSDDGTQSRLEKEGYTVLIVFFRDDLS